MENKKWSNKAVAGSVIAGAVLIFGFSSYVVGYESGRESSPDTAENASRIAKLEEQLCQLQVAVELVEPQKDPVNGRNRVVARDGELRDPRKVCAATPK